ncbi:MAG: hypothetical protein AAGA20_23450 [Planctomycetota bacterium]
MTTPIDIARDGNLFPREDLLEAVAQSDWRDRSVPLVAWVLASIGIALLTAGTPIARHVVTQPVETAASLEPALALPVHGIIAAVGRTGLGIEAAFFLGSALAFGASFLAVGLALRAAGFAGRLSLAATFVAVAASPLLLLHARLPSDAPFAALAAALVLAAIAAPHDPGAHGARGYAVRVAASVVFAAFLHRAALALAAPAAAAIAVKFVADASKLRLALLIAPAPLVAEGVARLVRGGAGPIFGGWIDLALAGGALWLALPLAFARESEEEPPPPWTLAWIVAALWLGPRQPGAAGALLVPLFAYLLAGVLARRARPDGALRWTLGFAAAQAALACAIAALVPSSTESFAATSFGETRPDDTVVVDDVGSIDAYLLRRRLGLSVVDDSDESAGGGRLLSLGRARDTVPFVLDAATGEVRSGE